MNLAYWSLGALILTIVVSCATEMNAGVLAIALAWLVGVVLGGMKAEQIVAGFPSSLFLTLVGVILLFTQAQANGTLERVAHRAVRLCRGNAGLIPIVFFGVAAALATVGPGNIATAALLAPVAMAVAVRSGIPAFLMAIMVGNGANAGALSPLAPTGIIAANLMAHIGLGGVEWRTYANNLLAHTVVAFGGYFLLGGWKLFRRSTPLADPETDCPAFETRHWITVGIICLLVAGVILFEVNVGMAAFAGAATLFALGAADHKQALHRMPWGVIVLVCGFTVLIAVLEKTSGMKLFTDVLAQFSTPRTVTAVVAFVAGLVSVYASTSGVILPTFLPTVPGLVQHLPGANAMAIASSINVGGHLVDVSPLSTIGALCLASLPAGEDSRRLFRQLLAWGLSMTLVGAIACYLMFR
ncbi:MAG: SLC13 family permease [Acidobacteriota bacterium]|nr:SLC13 family permease [Acidobacteriota bacterium]